MLLVLRLLPCRSIHILQDRLVATRFDAKRICTFLRRQRASTHTHTQNLENRNTGHCLGPCLRVLPITEGATHRKLRHLLARPRLGRAGMFATEDEEPTDATEPYWHTKPRTALEKLQQQAEVRPKTTKQAPAHRALKAPHAQDPEHPQHVQQTQRGRDGLGTKKNRPETSEGGRGGPKQH